MLVSEGKITMGADEAQQFKDATFAPWTPRSIAEFNAMCDLGSARHLVDNTEGAGFMHALAVEAMKFGDNGEANFPIDRRRMEFVRVRGTWPTDEELKEFEGQPQRAALKLVSKAD
jgi:hypothetical protein